MEFNAFVFPAPKSTYTSKDPDLIMIPFHQSNSKQCYEKEETLTSRIKVKASVLPQQPIQIQTVWAPHHEIPCMLYDKEMFHDGVIIYFHANAEDIGMTKYLAKTITSQIKVAFLAVEYPGYGIYKGDCTSNQMIQDAYAVMKYVLKRCHQENIIIMGRSIGTGVAVELATRYHKLKSLVLISPFTSLRDVIEEYAGKFFCQLLQERFRNLEKISKVKCPVLIIHGDQDNVVPISHSQKLLKQITSKSHLECLIGVDHNAFIFKQHISIPLLKFMLKIQDP